MVEMVEILNGLMHIDKYIHSCNRYSNQDLYHFHHGASSLFGPSFKWKHVVRAHLVSVLFCLIA